MVRIAPSEAKKRLKSRSQAADRVLLGDFVEDLRVKTFVNFLRDEEGQTSTEYILLVAVVALIVFKFREIATRELEDLTNGVFGKAGGILDDPAFGQ